MVTNVNQKNLFVKRERYSYERDLIICGFALSCFPDAQKTFLEYSGWSLSSLRRLLSVRYMNVFGYLCLKRICFGWIRSDQRIWAKFIVDHKSGLDACFARLDAKYSELFEEPSDDLPF